jgi:hypothetical protein
MSGPTSGPLRALPHVAPYMSDRWSDRIVLALATPHSLEFYAAIYAVAWGLGTMIWPEFLAYSNTRMVLDVLGGNGWLVGVVPFFAGTLGLFGLATGRRPLRAYSAVLAATFWWCATGFFFLSLPPVTSAVVAYGAAALAEAWVYVRVSEPLHALVRDVRNGAARHDRIANGAG